MDNEYLLEKKLGDGGTSIVYLSSMEDDGDLFLSRQSTGELTKNKSKTMTKQPIKVAIKVLSNKDTQDAERLLRVEYDALEKINHPNIIKSMKFGKGKIMDSNGFSKPYPYLVMEYAEHGDLFYFINVENRQGFSEEIARTVLRQMVYAVAACHENGICHRDIKIENFTLDSNFNLKLGDFGYAHSLMGENGQEFLEDNVGTCYYKPPEMWEPHPKYSGVKADIFSLGVTFFAFVDGNFAFNRATTSCIRYNYIIEKKYNLYWNASFRNKNKAQPSNEFKDLFQRMVSYDPNERPSIIEILSHPWFAMRNATQEEVLREFNERKQLI
ncbi:MAG: serine/threonine-protein kinase [archaeon]|nr:serine/threonine-protein kinase [archaeon]